MFWLASGPFNFLFGGLHQGGRSIFAAACILSDIAHWGFLTIMFRALHAFSFATMALLLGGVPHAQSFALANRSVQLTFQADARHAWLSRAATPGGASWSNSEPSDFPAGIEIDGRQLPIEWTFEAGATVHTADRLELVFQSPSPQLRLHWLWLFRSGDGPVEHRISIENLSGQELWLPHIESMNFQFIGVDGMHHFSVEKGADTPSDEGIHDTVIGPGFDWIGRSSNYARPMPGEAREIIPLEILYDPAGHHPGFYAGLEFSGRTRITCARGKNQQANAFVTRLGLNPEPGPYKTRLAAQGSFETPTAFLGVFLGGPDDASNQLRPWVRTVLGNPRTWSDPQYPLLVNNSWGSGMQVDEALALRMIGDSRELGLEMFHLDAGWFRGVGDWYPDPQKFPHGLAAVADAAHHAGLRFGLWTDWTQAGTDTGSGALNVYKVQDWLSHDVQPGWKTEEFKGQTIDIGLPAASDYAAGELKRIVESYHLDMLEHDGYLVMEGCMRKDHPHAPPNQSTLRMDHDSGFDFVVASNSTDVSYHATRAYYALYEQLRRQHPGLLFEICNDGGRMVDFGSAAHGDYFSITDSYDPLSNRRAFYDTSFALPAAMLESYVEKWPAPRIENFLYMLRSGMMGWTSIMLDTTAWTEEQHQAARTAFDLYKKQLRPLIRDAALYHASERPDGVHWDGMEFYDARRGKGVLFAFRGSANNEPAHNFTVRGLLADASYRLHFEGHSSPDRIVKGGELLRAGLTVALPMPLSSELVFLDEIRQ